jgi:hypothetical protein
MQPGNDPTAAVPDELLPIKGATKVHPIFILLGGAVTGVAIGVFTGVDTP